MSKRASRSQRRTSTKLVIGTWIASFLSAVLVYFTAVAVVSAMGAFRSCNSNSDGLSVSSCGKNGLNLGDIVLLALFLLSTALLVSLFTAALRMVRRPQ